MHRLTQDELRLARLIDRGLTYEQIGRELGIPARTVKSRTDRLRWTFGVKEKRYLPGIMRDLGLLK